MKMIRFAPLAAALVLACVAPMRAQEGGVAAPTQTPAASRALVAIKVQLVLSRYQGEKKLSSMPYIMWLTANDRERTNLRMGVEVPIGNGQGGFNYRSVGTNIDSRAETVDSGIFKVMLTINDSAVQFQDGDKPFPAVPSTPPALRSFLANFTILLRDGQTAQYTSASDPVSGEVLKVDATLNVLK
jgi:hypothetical protein